jgi:VIT1/CCC1 family predicted Fe2+/Mn2+ transporter
MAIEEKTQVHAAKKERIARLFCLLLALVGVIITAVPVAFTLEPYAVPLILVGCGVAVIALGTFMYFSI